MLAADVEVHGDGGGTSPSFRNPIYGRDRVAAPTCSSFGRHVGERGETIRRVEVNGQPGLMFLDPDGKLIFVMTIDIADGQVQTIRSVINPAKLRHLGPLSDFRALQRRFRRQPMKTAL